MNFGELQGYTRERTGTVNNDVISDRELARMLNLALGNLHQLLVNEYEDYEITTFLASLRGGPGNNFIPLPTDFLKLRAVDYGSQNQWVTLYGFGLQERNRYSNPIISMFVPYLGGAARAVRVMGQGIYIEPAIVSSGQYQVWYTPKFQDLENSDPLPIHMDTEGWVEYAVASAGVKIYTKLLLPPDAFLADRAYYQELVLTGAANRMSQGPKVMTNVRNVNDTIYPNGQGGFGGAGW